MPRRGNALGKALEPVPFSDIEPRLLRLRTRRGGGLASYFGGDVGAVETAVADVLSGGGSGARFGSLSALEMASDRALITGTSGGVHNDGLILANYSAWDPDAAQIISLDINSSIPNWGNNGGSSITFANEPWWNGASVPVATMRPPTIDNMGSGLGGIPFWKNATKIIRQINIRWEYLVSDAYCGNGINHPKYIIVRTYRQLSPSAGSADRPMLFLDNMTEGGPSVNLDNTLFLCVTQGTSRMFSAANVVPGVTSAQWVPGGDVGPASYCSMRQPFYHRPTAGVDGGGNPILATSEHVCVEMRVNVMATADEPNGIIAYRVYRRNGQVFERGCAWTWEDNKAVGVNYIADIDCFGGGYYNVANSGASNIWTKMGRRVTFGFNVQPNVGRAWIGPPTGFVQ